MIPFNNTYAKLPSRFHSATTPAKSPAPTLIEVNDELAKELGIDPEWLRTEQGLAVLSGNAIAEGSEPISQAYAGHQFGGFSPQLGDGRAVLLGEVIDVNGNQKDIQLKGSGRTAYSRGGDGKSALGPVIREYLMSEAMHALGVPTTRALAAVTTGEKVRRETPQDGGIFTRVASSHLRVGTFQFFAAREDKEALTILTDYALKRHYPNAENSPIPAINLLNAVMSAQVKLVAQWMSLGFIHGVMNTDNSSISGETIDYGPCAFMDEFHPQCVFSAIDRDARYAWGNQAPIAHWNLTRLGEALLPVIDDDQDKAIALVEQTLNKFSDEFLQHYLTNYSNKFGLKEGTAIEFIQDSLAMLAEEHIDYTLFFTYLTDYVEDETSLANFESLFADNDICQQWLADWKLRHDPAKLDTMQNTNPVLIPRNHQVEQAIQQAYQGDFTLFHRLNQAWKTPYQKSNNNQDLQLPPTKDQRVLQTFCGT